MKKAIPVLLLVAAAAVLLFAGQGEGSKTLRIHIRAMSNTAADQEVKYAVKDAVVDYLTPRIAGCDTKDEVLAMVRRELGALEQVACRVLEEEGFSYRAKVDIRREEFPTRVYRDKTFEAGVYDAIIVELGEAQGNNWWCVVYPPMCFLNYDADGGDFRYKSKLLELVEKYFAG